MMMIYFTLNVRHSLFIVHIIIEVAFMIIEINTIFINFSIIFLTDRALFEHEFVERFFVKNQTSMNRPAVVTGKPDLLEVC